MKIFYSTTADEDAWKLLSFFRGAVSVSSVSFRVTLVRDFCKKIKGEPKKCLTELSESFSPLLLFFLQYLNQFKQHRAKAKYWDKCFVITSMVRLVSFTQCIVFANRQYNASMSIRTISANCKNE